jgi:ketosteroid isomerase-like protein
MDFCGSSGIVAFVVSSCKSAPARNDAAAGEAAKNDVDGTVAFYADDAVLLAPNVPIATDKKSIRASWTGLLRPDVAVAWKISKVEVAKSGELGYLYGTYTLAIHDPKGRPDVHDTGKILEVWKKIDYRWKCIADTYNSDLPVAAGK